MRASCMAELSGAVHDSAASCGAEWASEVPRSLGHLGHLGQAAQNTARATPLLTHFTVAAHTHPQSHQPALAPLT
jgi:hypothetical protein